MTPPHFSACIFDFDGVIIDSEPLHAQAKRLTLEHFQIPTPPGELSEFKGRTDSDFFAYVVAELARGRVSARELDDYKRRLYLEMFDQVPLVPGSLDFVRAARMRFPRIGLVTSANRRDFSLAMDKFGIRSWFDVIVNGEDTLLHKPHPEPYLKALSELDLLPAETLVVEDSPNGIHSAKAAGCLVVAITTNFSASEVLSAGADFVGDSFPELARFLRIKISR